MNTYRFSEGRAHVPTPIAQAIMRTARRHGAQFHMGGGNYWFEIPSDGNEAEDRRNAQEVQDALRAEGVLALLFSATARQTRLKRSYR